MDLSTYSCIACPRGDVLNDTGDLFLPVLGNLRSGLLRPSREVSSELGPGEVKEFS